MAVSDKDKRIAYSIIRHLQLQVDSKVLPEDAAEGVTGENVRIFDSADILKFSSYSTVSLLTNPSYLPCLS